MITPVVMLRSTERHRLGALLAPLGQQRTGQEPAAVAAASTPGTVPSAAPSAIFLMMRCRMNRMTSAIAKITTMASGFASSQSDDSARPLLPVVS